MAIPTYAVQISFDPVKTAEASLTWQTISGVQEITEIGYGRDDELSQSDPGRAVFTLENGDGRFSPENASGAYYPNVKPMRQIRLQATFNAVTYNLFRGFVERWDVRAEPPQYVIVTCVDGFLRLARARISTSYGAQLSGARVGAVLDSIGWPASLRDLDAGVSTLPAATLSNVQALQHLNEVVQVEDGVFWVDGRGYAVFRDRHARLTDTVSSVSQATFGGASGLPYQTPALRRDSRDIYNDVRITRTGGAQQVRADSTSDNDYGTQTYTLESPHFQTDVQALDYAGWFLYQHKDPLPRLDRIVVEAGGDDTLWEKVLSLEINHRITVVHQFPGNLALNREFWIEGIRRDLTDGLNRHLVEYRLSAANPREWFILDSSTQGVLDTNRIGF